MPRRPRVEAATGFYHVINRSVRKQPLFTQPGDYRAFIEVLGEGMARFDVSLVAYCVLHNHWHLLFGPLGKERLSEVMQWVTSTHAVRWHRAHGTTGQGHVYQDRFTSTPLHDISSLVPMARYVERNAKSAGLTDRAEDWPWCSLAQRFLGRNDVPLSDAKFLQSITWLEYVNATLTLREQAREQAAMTVPRQRQKPTSVPKTAKTVEKGSDPVDDPVRRSARRDRLRRRDR